MTRERQENREGEKNKKRKHTWRLWHDVAFSAASNAQYGIWLLSSTLERAIVSLVSRRTASRWHLTFKTTMVEIDCQRSSSTIEKVFIDVGCQGYENPVVGPLVLQIVRGRVSRGMHTSTHLHSACARISLPGFDLLA